MASSLSCDVCFEQFTGGARWIQIDKMMRNTLSLRGRRGGKEKIETVCPCFSSAPRPNCVCVGGGFRGIEVLMIVFSTMF